MNLKNVEGRIVVKADKDGKNWHTFSDGKKIRLERDYNNLDYKYTKQVLGEVVSADNIPAGAMILFHHNCIHPVNQIFNHSKLSGEEVKSGVEIFSFSTDECYLWKMPGDKEWKPLKGFATALRVFEPYLGVLQNIPHKKIENILYLTSGNLKGNVCHTLKACDMPIIFNNDEGVEETIIRCRHFEDEEHEREEIVVINHDLTKKIENGSLYVGVTEKDCKPIK